MKLTRSAYAALGLSLPLLLQCVCSFTLPTRALKPSFFRLASNKFEVTVLTESGEKTIQIGQDEYILEALETAGIDQASSCRTGTCGTCACRITNGMTDVIAYDDDPDAIEKGKKDQGFFLACVAHLTKSGATFKTNQEDECNAA